MRYLEWVDRVFKTIVEGYQSGQPYIYGLNIDAIAERLNLADDRFGPAIMAVANAREDLFSLGLLEAHSIYSNRLDRVVPYKPTTLGKDTYQEGLPALWDSIASVRLGMAEQDFLEALAGLSLKEHEEFADAEPVEREEISTALEGKQDDYQLEQVVEDLLDRALVASFGDQLRITYTGAVWVDQNLAGWRKRWKPVEGARHSAGGQGRVTKVVERASSLVLGALKELHPQHLRDSERRGRMRREINILERVEIDGVPRVLDHNIDQAGEAGKPLYLVTEWVEGETLTKRINGRPEVLDTALLITRDAARILQACHSAKVWHRDIKADNILIDSDTLKVHIIDFGIAWAEPDPAVEDIRTELGQDLRNKWFSLPDLAAGRAKQDKRTDITQLLGVLIYMLTGKTPRVLTDEQGRPPHQALAINIPKSTRNDPRWRQLEIIFDKGFQPNLDARFQEIDELLPLLEALVEENPDDYVSEEEAAGVEVLPDHAIEALTKSAIASTPIEADEKFAFLYLVAEPGTMDGTLLKRAFKGQDAREFFASLLGRAAPESVFPRNRGFGPDFSYPAADVLLQVDGWEVTIKPFSLSEPKSRRSPYDVLDAYFLQDGRVWLFCGTAAERGADGRMWLKDDLIAGISSRFVFMVGDLYARAHYVGDVRIGVVITNTMGVESPNVKRGAGIIGPPPPPYSRAEYRRFVKVAAAKLNVPERARLVATHLVMPLISAVSQGKSQPFP